MNLLSERVGPDGAVVGVEREPRFVDMARTQLSERGLRNVSVANADALKTGLEKNSYDIVHERLVLIKGRNSFGTILPYARQHSFPESLDIECILTNKQRGVPMLK
jgi:hypothetical protein